MHKGKRSFVQCRSKYSQVSMHVCEQVFVVPLADGWRDAEVPGSLDFVACLP